jgi:HlyD family secretion protein
MGRRLVRRSTVLSAVAVVFAAGGSLAWANVDPAAPAYRTALVATGDVAQLLTATGSVQNIDRTKVSFPVTGTVATVTTEVGATVTKGQVLASLVTAPLTDAVVAATAVAAKAAATLEADSATTSAPTTTSTTSSKAPTTTPAGNAPASSAGIAKALADSARLLATAQQSSKAVAVACGPASSPRPSNEASPAATPTESATASPTPAAAGRNASVDDCATALTAALSAEQKVAAAQVAVSRALQPSATAAGVSAPAAKTTPAAPAASAAANATAGGGNQAATSGETQAARVTTDGAAVAAADVALVVAKSNLAGATLTSPVAGRIASQPFAVGASSGALSIVVVAPGAMQVTANVPATALPTLRVGQAAVVTPDGTSRSIAGTVAAIGLLPTSSTSGSTTTYPVTVLVTKPGSALVEGAAASVAITVKAVKGVLTVPNSALSDGAVTVLSQGKTVVTRVQTGAAGPLRTEVTSGLRLGQQVVLADLSAALPANSTTTRGFGATGGPPGAGGFGGGATGGQGTRPGG